MNTSADHKKRLTKVYEEPPRTIVIRSYRILQIVTLLVTGLFLVSFLIQPSYADVPMETISEALMKDKALSAMVNEDRAGLRRSYGIDAGAAEGFCLFRSSSNMNADELLIVKAADEAAAKALLPAANARLETLHANFDHYGVSEVSKLNKAIVKVRGPYLFFAVSDSAQSWEKIFLEEVGA